MTDQTYEAMHNHFPEPEILSNEIEFAINDSPQNKWPGAYGLPKRAIKEGK